MTQKYETITVGNTREERGHEIFKKKGSVVKVSDSIYTVRSQTGVGEYRLTNESGEWSCNCPDYIKNDGIRCKHIHALQFYLSERLNGRNGRTISRAWKEYNLAQMNEEERFNELLRELVDTVPDEQQTMGRPRLPIQDQLFCAIQKVYWGRSMRRTQSILNRSESEDLLEHSPHINVVSRVLNREDMTPLLRKLLQMTASPMSDIEDTFAVDSSGFRTTSYSQWCQEKHGKSRENIWLKAHAIVGVHTNIIVDAIITDSSVNDCPLLPELVETTDKMFKVKEVSADKGYLSKENYEAIAKIGADAYIMFKDNSRGRAKGSPAWKNAFYYFQNNREDFMQHYHMRSNVESFFYSVKAKIGETIRSKNPVAQVNEMYCKLIAYNLITLAGHIYTDNIEPKFQVAVREQTATQTA